MLVNSLATFNHVLELLLQSHPKSYELHNSITGTYFPVKSK